MRRSPWLAAAALVVVQIAVLPTAASAATTTVFVPAGLESGVSTGIDLAAGDRVTVTATGIAQTASFQPPTDPNGLWPDGGSASCIGIPETCLALTTASALVAKVGAGDWTFVGSGPVTLTGVGQVRLAYNDAIGFFGDNSGGYTAVLDLTRATPPCAAVTARQPIKADGTSVFKAGSTVPVKFGCSDGGLAPTLDVSKVSASTAGGTTHARLTDAAAKGALFRYDASASQYIYSLSTKQMTAGTYRLDFNAGGTTIGSVRISLR